MASCPGKRGTSACNSTLYRCKACNNVGCEQSTEGKCTNQGFRAGTCMKCGKSGQRERFN
jgi:hypothetical protein